MEENNNSPFVIDVVEIDNFLSHPPQGFSIEHRAAYRLVKSDPKLSCVFIDEFQSSKGKVIFCQSPGRKITVRNLGEYTNLRNQLLSKRIYVLVSACATIAPKVQEKKRINDPALGLYVVVINGCHPMIRWEMEKGLDSTISSVAGESYTVNVDIRDALKACVGEKFRILIDGEKVKPSWKDTHFTIKYHSDALFDFSYWFGLSKREIKISYCGR
ncbi:mesenteric estrogen-dependent adipogenesis protein-like [Triplophysa dalaica]|uniref:mesenteric estrogen-dependent adipogenesis protein-like n=1 Tax=Triplophysa dalaica TaxID=1582913 RepID=UPI0024DFADCB|nr:mesenteric estrogen-dependent adipogenesis protein-like [Triplophysa dalaica]